MPRFTRSDDGKVVDGKTVVWIEPAGDQAEIPGAAKKLGSARPEVRQALVAKAQAAALIDAAKKGHPFCEECEAARKKLAARAKANP